MAAKSSDDRSKNDLLANENIRLNSNLISDILSHYLRCEPTQVPYKIPEFRLDELCDIACRVCSSNAELLESIGSMYALCLHCAVSPVHGTCLQRYSSIIMSVLCECASMMDRNEISQLGHPFDIMKKRLDEYKSVDALYDTFRFGLELSRDILRELIRQVRVARDLSKKAQAIKHPKECVQLHSIYFMCAFGLTHLSAVLHHAHESDRVPGLTECLVLMLCTDMHPSHKNEVRKASVATTVMSMPIPQLGETQANTSGHSQPNAAAVAASNAEEVKITMEGCLSLSSKLTCQVAKIVLEKNRLKQLHQYLTNLTKHMHQPDVPFARMRCSHVTTFLSSPPCPNRVKVTEGIYLLGYGGNETKLAEAVHAVRAKSPTLMPRSGGSASRSYDNSNVSGLPMLPIGEHGGQFPVLGTGRRLSNAGGEVLQVHGAPSGRRPSNAAHQLHAINEQHGQQSSISGHHHPEQHGTIRRKSSNDHPPHGGTTSRRPSNAGENIDSHRNNNNSHEKNDGDQHATHGTSSRRPSIAGAHHNSIEHNKEPHSTDLSRSASRRPSKTTDNAPKSDQVPNGEAESGAKPAEPARENTTEGNGQSVAGSKAASKRPSRQNSVKPPLKPQAPLVLLKMPRPMKKVASDAISSVVPLQTKSTMKLPPEQTMRTETDIELAKQLIVMSSLKQQFRVGFGVMQTIRLPNVSGSSYKTAMAQLYPSDYDPVGERKAYLKTVAALMASGGEKSIQQINQDFECSYYEFCNEQCVPRHMIPSCGQFWLCFLTIKFLLQAHETFTIFGNDEEFKLKFEQQKPPPKVKKAPKEEEKGKGEPLKSALKSTIDKEKTAAAKSEKNSQKAKKLALLKTVDQHRQKVDLASGNSSSSVAPPPSADDKKLTTTKKVTVKNTALMLFAGSLAADSNKSRPPSPTSPTPMPPVHRSASFLKSPSKSLVPLHANFTTMKERLAMAAHTGQLEASLGQLEKKKQKENVMQKNIADLLEINNSLTTGTELIHELDIASKLQEAELKWIEALSLTEDAAPIGESEDEDDEAYEYNDDDEDEDDEYSADDEEYSGIQMDDEENSDFSSQVSSNFAMSKANDNDKTRKYSNGKNQTNSIRNTRNTTPSNTHKSVPDHDFTMDIDPDSYALKPIYRDLEKIRKMVAEQEVALGKKPSIFPAIVTRANTPGLNSRVGTANTHDFDDTASLASMESMSSTTKSKKIPKSQRVSVIWCSCPVLVDEDPSSAFAKKSAQLNSLPPEEAAREYAKQIHMYKDNLVKIDLEKKREMADQQEAEVGKFRSHKMQMTREARDLKRDNMVASIQLRKRYDQEDIEQRKQELINSREEKMKEKRANERECLRIFEIKSWRDKQLQDEEVARKYREDYEQIRLRAMTDKKEFAEILRREAEEQRMRYLEEKQRVIENKRIAKEKAIEDELKSRQEAVRNIKHQYVNRLRSGNFMTHNGKYGFYDDVRKESVPYIQYEDDSGVPYYFDPLTNFTQYEKPEDATIEHYLKVEERQYDATNGEGAWKKLKEHEEYVYNVNTHGGYYNEEGTWTSINGFFDEAGTFIDLGEGYFNKKGVYVKYPKISGTLDFMC